MPRTILVCRAKEIFESIEAVLSSRRVEIEWETAAERAVARARQDACPVVLVTEECNWRFVVEGFGSQAERPNVVVLLPRFDPGLWAQGLQAGAFDVLPITADAERLSSTVMAAQQRWERRQLTHAAKAENPLIPSSA